MSATAPRLVTRQAVVFGGLAAIAIAALATCACVYVLARGDLTIRRCRLHVHLTCPFAAFWRKHGPAMEAPC